MPTRICTVSFRDWQGMEHAVEVSAETLFEAAVLGLREFRAAGFSDHVAPGSGARVTVTVRLEHAQHEVGVKQLEEWLAGVGKSPREQTIKARLRQIIAS